MLPLVSILIPVYNSEKWLEETICSALSQSWENIEVVVVNDGSTDNTANILKKYKSSIKIIDTENKGASAARNLGFYESKGEFVQFLDSDDILDKNKIEIQLKELINSSNCCVATGPWERFYNNEIDNISFTMHPDYKNYNTPIEWILDSWNGYGTMPPVSWLIPRKLINKAGLWNEELSLCDDTEFFTRIALNSDRILFCSEAKGYYRSGNPSLSGRKDVIAYKSLFRVCELSTLYLLAYENSKRTRQASANLWQTFIYEVYPRCSNLIGIAENKVSTLGGSNLKAPGGPIFQIISNFTGWKFARKIQRVFYLLGYKKLRKFVKSNILKSICYNLIIKTPFHFIPVNVKHGLSKGAKFSIFPYSSYWRFGGAEKDIEYAIQNFGPDKGGKSWDIGAHFGIYSLGMALLVGDEGQVVCFEPDSFSFKKLSFHVELNKLKNVKMYNFAVSDNTGISELIDTGYGAPFSRLAYNYEDGNSNRNKKKVETVKLDDIIQSESLYPPDFIKIDIEGHGHKALLGAINTINKFKPNILMSFHSDEELFNSIKILKNVSYNCYNCYGEKITQPTSGFRGDILFCA